MPRKYVRRPRRRRRRKKGKVYKRGIPRKALSGAIDTALEKRMQVIARKEAQANVVKLIDRNFYWGRCNPITNHWTGMRRIYFDGVVQEILKVDKIDINQVLNAPDPDDQEPPEQKEQDMDGAQQGMTTETIHGKRTSDVIKVSAFQIALKMFIDRVPDEFNYNHAYNANNNPEFVGEQAYHQFFLRQQNGAYDRYMPETVTLEYGIYEVKDDQAIVSPQIRPVPSVDALITKRPWGWSPSLDNVSLQTTSWIKKKCLMKGQVTYQLRASVHRDKTINKYVRLKKPITVRFLPEDQNGEQKVTSRFFFAARTNIPQLTQTQTVDYAPFAPRCALCVKSHYVDA